MSSITSHQHFIHKSGLNKVLKLCIITMASALV